MVKILAIPKHSIVKCGYVAQRQCVNWRKLFMALSVEAKRWIAFKDLSRYENSSRLITPFSSYQISRMKLISLHETASKHATVALRIKQEKECHR
jgi:hypothetical protein